MADDIVERLRTSRDWSDAIPTMEEAAEEITRLRAENEKLREALAAAIRESGDE